MKHRLEAQKIYTYTFYPIDSRMYVILEQHKALIIDPCISEEALHMLKEKAVSELFVVLTHEHYDHISGVNWLREQFEKVRVFCSESCAGRMENPNENLSSFWEVLFMGKDKSIQEYVRKMNIPAYSCRADETFQTEKEIIWEGHSLYVKETPGHSPGSICLLLDEKTLFSGDTLVSGFPTITRLPGGSKNKFRQETIPFLDSLSKDIVVCPGHGDRQKLSEYPWD